MSHIYRRNLQLRSQGLSLWRVLFFWTKRMVVAWSELSTLSNRFTSLGHVQKVLMFSRQFSRFSSWNSHQQHQKSFHGLFFLTKSSQSWPVIVPISSHIFPVLRSWTPMRSTGNTFRAGPRWAGSDESGGVELWNQSHPLLGENLTENTQCFSIRSHHFKGDFNWNFHGINGINKIN